MLATVFAAAGPHTNDHAALHKRYNAEFWVDGYTQSAIIVAMAMARQAGGGLVRLPSGIYTRDTNEVVVVPSNVSLVGMGPSTVIYNDTDYGSIELEAGASNIYIGNMRFDGDANPTNPVDGRGAINDRGADDVVIENLWIRNVNTCGIVLGVTSRVSAGLIVRNLHISNTREHGVYLSHKRGAALDGIIVTDAARAGTQGNGIKIVDSVDVVASNLVSTNNKAGAAITIHASAIDKTVANVQLVNCIGKSSDAGWYGLYISRAAHDITVNGGYFEGDYGIRLTGEGDSMPKRVLLNGVNAKCNGTAYALDVAAGSNIYRHGGMYQGNVQGIS